VNATSVVLVLALLTALAVFAVSSRRELGPHPVEAAERALRREVWRHPKVVRFGRERLDRESAGGLLLTLALAGVFVVALGLGLLLDLIDENDTVARLDASVSRWGADHATSGTVDVLKAITQLGSTWWSVLMLTTVAVVDHIRHRRPSVFGYVAAVGLGELLLNNLLKVVVGRDRPDVLHLVGAGGLSFPSGHSAAAAAAWSAAAIVLSRGRRRRVRAAMVAVGATVAVAVGASRAMLGVHWVTDVVAGLLLGWGWSFVVAVVYGGRHQRLGDPVIGMVDRGRTSTATSATPVRPRARTRSLR
jgi:membrane-associated phospholipid phosphatase